MDLLRLILAHQPYVTLQKFPRLLRSSSFQLVRQQFVNTSLRKPGEGYYEQCSREGELFLSMSGQRDIFLLEADAIFGHSKTDFWYAISTGVPEIQDAAVQEMLPEADFFAYNDLYAIPWTPDLENGLLKYKDRMLEWAGSLRDEKKEKLVRLLGFLGVEDPSLTSFSYFEGRVRRILRGETVLERREDIEDLFKKTSRKCLWAGDLTELIEHSSWDVIRKIIYSGYLYPVISANFSLEKLKIVAFETANEELFRYISSWGNIDIPHLVIALPDVITRSFVIRARNILADPTITLSGSSRVVYQILAGEILENLKTPMSAIEHRARLLVANGNLTRKIGSVDSLQSLVIYEPVRHYQTSEAARQECQRLGIVP